MSPTKTEEKGIGKDGAVNDKEKFLGVALKRFSSCVDHTQVMREAMLDDNRFKAGNQWPDDIIRDRERDKRPALTTNRLLAFINRTVNDGLQNLPTVKYRPTDKAAAKDTADMVSGLTRHILNNGDSQDALGWAFDQSVSSGFGAFRVKTEYADCKSFEQEIKLERIDNAATVYVPIHLCKSPDFSDAPFMFIRTKMSNDDFEEKYPDVDTSTWERKGTGDANWISEDGVYVAEYFVVNKKVITIYLLTDGTVVEEEPKDKSLIVKKRESCERTVSRYVLTEGEILEEEKAFPSKYIPIIIVYGQEINVDGEKQFLSITRMAKDPQKMHNYWVTAFTEQIALQPKAPFMVEEGQVEGYTDQWKELNTKAMPYITYKSTNNMGVPTPPPQRVQPPVIGDAIIRGIELSSEALKETTGIFDASLGSQGNEKSGVAIIARQKQGDVSNFHFMNNFQRSIRYLGRVIMDMIPRVYDTPRSIQILGEDMAEKIIRINEEFSDPKNPGQMKLYDFRVGKYEVVVDTGPSYETKRVEAVETLMRAIQSAPQIAPLVMDILMRNMDAPWASQVADRLKLMLPPQIAQSEQSEDAEHMTPDEMRAIIADVQKLHAENQQHQQDKAQLAQIIGELQKQLKSKEAEISAKVATAQIRANAELKKAEIQANQADQHKAIDTALQIHSMSQPSHTMSNQQGSLPVGTTEDQTLGA